MSKLISEQKKKWGDAFLAFNRTKKGKLLRSVVKYGIMVSTPLTAFAGLSALFGRSTYLIVRRLLANKRLAKSNLANAIPEKSKSNALSLGCYIVLAQASFIGTLVTGGVALDIMTGSTYCKKLTREFVVKELYASAPAQAIVTKCIEPLKPFSWFGSLEVGDCVAVIRNRDGNSLLVQHYNVSGNGLGTYKYDAFGNIIETNFKEDSLLPERGLQPLYLNAKQL